jgi:hypothetical protein
MRDLSKGWCVCDWITSFETGLVLCPLFQKLWLFLRKKVVRGTWTSINYFINYFDVINVSFIDSSLPHFFVLGRDHRNPTTRSRIVLVFRRERECGKSHQLLLYPENRFGQLWRACTGWPDESIVTCKQCNIMGIFVKSGHPVCGFQLLRYPSTSVYSAETFLRKNNAIRLVVVRFLWARYKSNSD